MKLSALASAKAYYRLVVAGGGTGGCAISHALKRIFPSGEMAIIEPREEHHYQPGYTLVASGMVQLPSCIKRTDEVLHRNAIWLKNHIVNFNPNESTLTLENGLEVKYDILIIGLGLQLRYDMVKGLPEGFDAPGVCSIYRGPLAEKTNREINSFKGGTAIFTFPNTPIKCAGAPQKICYVADDIFRQNGVRDKTTIMYNTSLGRVFGIEKYANALSKLIKEKSIKLNVRRNIMEVDVVNKRAYFEELDDNACSTGRIIPYQYDFLHVGPPCSPVKVLRECSELTDAKGWLEVDAKTLRSVRYENVFGIGDCLNTGNAKTGAAVSSQMAAIVKNVEATVKGKPLTGEYDGYASCPILVSTRRAILAEFSPSGPMETLPINQAKPRYISYLLKRYFIPFLYWNFLIKGLWYGPSVIRKILHLGYVK